MRRVVAIVFVAAALVAGCGDGGGGGGGSAATFCEDARALKDKFESAFGEDFSFETIDAFINDLEDLTPPAEIADDFETLINGLRQARDILEPIKDKDLNDPEVFSDPEVLAAFEELEKLDTEELDAASERIDEYTQEECGFTLDDTTTTVGS